MMRAGDRGAIRTEGSVVITLELGLAVLRSRQREASVVSPRSAGGAG